MKNKLPATIEIPLSDYIGSLKMTYHVLLLHSDYTDALGLETESSQIRRAAQVIYDISHKLTKGLIK